MAVTETHRTETAGLHFGVLSLFSMLTRWNDKRLTRNALSKLTTRELNDIGLSKADLQRF